MARRAGFRIASGLICITATGVAVAASPTPLAPPEGPGLAPRSHQIMLYLIKPLGGGGGSLLPKFGFRVDQIRMMVNRGAGEGDDPFQHRPLVGWQMDGGSDMRASGMRVDFGGRVSYDVAKGAFAAQAARSPLVAGPRQIPADRDITFSGSSPIGTHTTETGFTTKARPVDTRGFSTDSSMARDIAAAAIATFKSSRLTPAQQRMGLEQRSLRDGG
jgi:hypothetical protein